MTTLRLISDGHQAAPNATASTRSSEAEVLTDLVAAVRQGALSLSEGSHLRQVLLKTADRWLLLARLRGVDL